MNKLVYILLFVSNIGISQNFSSNKVFEYNDTNSININVFGNGNYGSSLFNNELIDIFRLGGFVTPEMKDAALSKAKRLNYFGGEATYGISFSDPIHKLFNNWGYYAEISNNISAGVQFTDDIYKLVFYGNKNSVGDSLVLGQTGFHSRNFRKYSFGIDDNKLKIGLSFLSFGQNNQGLIQSGYVYTDTNISSLSMSVDANQYQSSKHYKHTGSGIGLDFEYRLHQKQYTRDSSDTKESTIIVGMKNIGIYYSRNNSVLTEVDTTYAYEGFEISSLSEFGNSLVSQQQLEDTLNLKKDTSRIIGILPFEVYFYKPATGNKKLESIYGFRYKIQSNYRAFLYFGGNLNFKNGLNITSFMAYGGYSKLQIGLSLYKKFNNLLFELNSNNVLGIFSKNQYGKGAGISIKYNLK